MRDNFKVLTGVSWETRIKRFGDGPSLAPLPHPKITVLPPAKNSPPGKLSKVTKKGKETAEAEETPEALQRKLEAAFAAQKYRYRVPAEGTPRGTMPDGPHYAHQTAKSVYDLFGKFADRGAEMVAAKEAEKEEIKRLRRMALKRQNQQPKIQSTDVVVIDSDDEEEGEEEEDEESVEDEEEAGEDEEMEDGYVAVNAAGKDVDMQNIDSVDAVGNGAGAGAGEEDFTMVDAPTAQT